MRSVGAPSAARQRAIHCDSRRRGVARNVLIHGSGVVMRNYMCGNELVERSTVSASTKRLYRIACGSHAVPIVLRSRNVPSARTRNARSSQAVTQAQTGHGMCSTTPPAMTKAAFWALWCFILVLPWDVLTKLPVVGSIPRLVGLL